MEGRAPNKRQVGLSLTAAILFLLAAVVTATSALLSHQPVWGFACAIAFGGAALLWFVVYLTWKARAYD